MLRIDANEKSNMASPRGSKQTCESDTCGRRFYDLKRSPIACPYCGASVDAHAVVDVDFETIDKRQFSKSSRWAAPRKPVVEVSRAEDEAVDTDQAADDKDEAAPPENQELLIDIDDEEPDAPPPAEDNNDAT
jgi:uncharacterized protein (TIGR02300 family)